MHLTRRGFLRVAAGTALAPAILPCQAATRSLQVRELGRSGAKVTLFGLGGSSALTPLSNGRRDESLKLVSRALELGVRLFDTSRSYGTSEQYLGEALSGQRSSVFLSTKTDARTRDGALRDLEESLKKLRTDHVDLWLIHSVALEGRDTRPSFAPGGCIEALEEAKRQKMARLVGFSGHRNPLLLAEWLRRYPFDAVLAPINCTDLHQQPSFIRNLLPLARERRVPVIAIKIPAYGRNLSPEHGVGMKEAMHYSLSQAGVVSCLIGCDNIKQLEENVTTAREFKGPLDVGRLRQIEAATALYWKERKAAFYREWT